VWSGPSAFSFPASARTYIFSASHHVLTSSDRDPSNHHGDSAFIIGAGTVIEGIDLAVMDMTPGEKSIFTIPS
jgi:FKBP-type peptidyl-prolyl cis-trans isomerase 2